MISVVNDTLLTTILLPIGFFFKLMLLLGVSTAGHLPSPLHQPAMCSQHLQLSKFTPPSSTLPWLLPISISYLRRVPARFNHSNHPSNYLCVSFAGLVRLCYAQSQSGPCSLCPLPAFPLLPVNSSHQYQQPNSNWVSTDPISIFAITHHRSQSQNTPPP